MTKQQDQDITVSDREYAIDLVYDVALDPERYESLLDFWETMIAPLRPDGAVGIAPILDDPLIAKHFRRASHILDHAAVTDQHDPLHDTLAGFEKFIAFSLDQAGRITATNTTARKTWSITSGQSIADLPILSRDLDALADHHDQFQSRLGDDETLLRVRSVHQDRLVIIRIKRFIHDTKGPLAIVIANELA